MPVGGEGWGEGPGLYAGERWGKEGGLDPVGGVLLGDPEGVWGGRSGGAAVPHFRLGETDGGRRRHSPGICTFAALGTLSVYLLGIGPRSRFCIYAGLIGWSAVASV